MPKTVMKLTFLSTLIFLTSQLLAAPGTDSGPGMSTGIKVGEVTQTSARLWVRLTSNRVADSSSHEKAAPGSSGSVKLTYWAEGGEKRNHPETKVDATKDFTCQLVLKDLKAGTSYLFEATAINDGQTGATIKGKFKTPPAKDQIARISGLVVTCQGHETVDDPAKGHWVYKQMLTHDPDFFVHTGDVLYYDKDKKHPYSKNEAAARQRWNRMFGYAWNRDFHSQVSSYFMKDDHDTLKNDCWPGQTYGELTFERGLELFKEQTPQGDLPYRTIRWGKDLQIWIMEGRDYRSSNRAKDGPDKTILGKVQKAWLKKGLKESDATFKLAIFPSPVVGPDKKGKKDNHSNKVFFTEGQEMRDFLSSIPNTFVVCGDRHWQYASKDPKTGLIEICSGPINNYHATRGGNADHDPKLHIYYGRGLGGYLNFIVDREEGKPTIRFRWHSDMDHKGKLNKELKFEAE